MKFLNLRFLLKYVYRMKFFNVMGKILKGERLQVERYW